MPAFLYKYGRKFRLRRNFLKFWTHPRLSRGASYLDWERAALPIEYLFVAFLQDCDHILARERMRIDAEQAAHGIECVVRDLAELVGLYAVAG